MTWSMLSCRPYSCQMTKCGVLRLTKEACCHGGFCDAKGIDGGLLCSSQKLPNDAMHVWASQQSHQRERWCS